MDINELLRQPKTSRRLFHIGAWGALIITSFLVFFASPYIVWLLLRLISGDWYLVIPGKHEKQISQKLQQSYASGKNELAVRDIVNFNWNDVCMVDTAASKSEVERVLKKPIEWNKENIPWLFDGDYWTLIFQDANSTLQFVKLRKGKTGNPVPLSGQAYCAPNKEAVFAFRRYTAPTAQRHDLILMRR